MDFNKLATYLFGSGTTTFAKDKPPVYVQNDPNIIQRIQGGFSSLFNKPTPSAPPVSPTTSPVNLSGLQQSVAPSFVAPVPSPTVSSYGRNTETYHNPNTPSSDVVSAINNAAKTFGGDNADLLKSILYDVGLQESHFHPNLVNTTPEGIKAGNPTGLYQFTDGTWQDVLNQYNNQPGMSLHLPTTDRTDPTTNALAAAYLISNGQLGKWNASQGSWGPLYTKDEVTPFYNQSQDSLGWSGLVPWMQ